MKAAQDNHEVLRADWSNLFQCRHACNALFDLGSIWEGAEGNLEIEKLIKDWYDMLTAESTQNWTLADACSQHKCFPPSSLFSRPLAEIFGFYSSSFALSTHAIGQFFEDNHVGLLRNTFVV